MNGTGEPRRGEKHNAAEEGVERTGHMYAQTSTICHRILTRS